MYCGDAAEMIQPLLLIGINTPMSMPRPSLSWMAERSNRHATIGRTSAGTATWRRKRKDLLRRGRHLGCHEQTAQVLARRRRRVFRRLAGVQAGRDAADLGVVLGVVEEYERQAPAFRAAVLRRVGDSVQCRDPGVVGPAGHQIAEGDEETGRGG